MNTRGMKSLLMVQVAGLCLAGSVALAEADYSLVVSIACPPVALVVMDEQGLRAGIDMSVTLSAWGEGKDICEIPGAWVEQMNISNDDPNSSDAGEPQPSTTWSVYLNHIPADGVAHRYGVSLYGVKAGSYDLYVGANPHSRTLPAPRRINVPVLVDNGVTRQLEIEFTPGPAGSTQTVRRLVAANDLDQDVVAARKSGLIASDGVSRSLEAKAQAAAAAAKRGNRQAARGAWQAFLKELKAQDGKHVQEPALTILREEAEALLNPPPPMPKPKKPKAGGAGKPAK